MLISTAFDAALTHVAAICQTLPNVRQERAWLGTRWKVRTQTFAHLLPIVDARPPAYSAATGTVGPAIVLTFRSTPLEIAALVQSKRNFFGPLWGRNDVAVILATDTDWTELAELLTESHRLRSVHR